MLTEFGVVLGDFRQCRVVRLAQFRTVHHGIEMADLPPGAMQMLVGIFQRADEVVPVRRGLVCGYACNQRTVLREQLLNSRRDIGGFEIGKAG